MAWIPIVSIYKSKDKIVYDKYKVYTDKSSKLVGTVVSMFYVSTFNSEC